jgi:2-dehydropantoate 2-reductase
VAADRVAILGAGSTGCFIGGCWLAAGLPVTFIGRERIAAEITKTGLTISDFSGMQTSFSDVDYRTDPAAVAEADIIALCVKSGSTEDAIHDISAHARDGALVISFQNGIRNFDLLEETLSDRFEVARGLVSYNVAYLGEGRFHKGVAGVLWAGDLPRTRILSERIGEGPAKLCLSDDMLGLAWGKLLINLNNAVNALSGRTLLEQLKQRDYRRVVAASQREGLALLNAAGIQPAKVGAVGPAVLPRVIDSPDWVFRNIFLKKWKIDEKARSSMADDLTAGRKTEVDYLNGELVALAEQLGREAPINRKIVELVRAAEAGAAPLPPAQLRQAVLG